MSTFGELEHPTINFAMMPAPGVTSSQRNSSIKLSYKIIKNYKTIDECHSLINTFKSNNDLKEIVSSINIEKDSLNGNYLFIVRFQSNSDSDYEITYNKINKILNINSL